MADFACITRSLKKQFLTPHIRKRKPRTRGCRASRVPFWGTVMGWGCPSPNRNNSRRLREDDRSAVGDSHFVTCKGAAFFSARPNVRYWHFADIDTGCEHCPL